MVWHVGRADRTEENCVMGFQPVQTILRHHPAMRLVIVRTPVISRDIKGEAAVARREGLQDPNTGIDHLGSDAIGRNGCNLVILQRNGLSSQNMKDVGRCLLFLTGSCGVENHHLFNSNGQS